MKGDLPERLSIFFDGDVLRVTGECGVVSAEEDGHEADVGEVLGGRGGREEAGEGRDG